MYSRRCIWESHEDVVYLTCFSHWSLLLRAQKDLIENRNLIQESNINWLSPKYPSNLNLKVSKRAITQILILSLTRWSGLAIISFKRRKLVKLPEMTHLPQRASFFLEWLYLFFRFQDRYYSSLEWYVQWIQNAEEVSKICERNEKVRILGRKSPSVNKPQLPLPKPSSGEPEHFCM